MKQRSEVEKLKADWAKDPCWDIETTEGFEDYHDELKEFSEHKNAEWGKAAVLRREEALKNAPAFSWAYEDGEIVNGLTKREYFAAMAMQALISHYGDQWSANEAVCAADTMIEKLNQQNLQQ